MTGEVPLTDVPSESLLDSKTPLDSQPEVQGTLASEQQHAAVYSPGVNEAPEQTPEQIAAASGEAYATQESAGAEPGLSKQAKRDKQQGGRVSPGRSGRTSSGPGAMIIISCIIPMLSLSRGSTLDHKHNSTQLCIGGCRCQHALTHDATEPGMQTPLYAWAS